MFLKIKYADAHQGSIDLFKNSKYIVKFCYIKNEI